MRKRIKLIYDLLERIAVAGPAVDIMATVRQELIALDQQAKVQTVQKAKNEAAIAALQQESADREDLDAKEERDG